MKNLTNNPWWGYAIALVGVFVAVKSLLDGGDQAFTSVPIGLTFVFIGLATASATKKK